MEQLKITIVYNILVFILYFIGNTVVGNISKKNEPYTNIFFSLLVGWISLILVGSLVFTHFKTIHIGWLLLILIALVKKRFNIQISWKIRSSEILRLLLFSNILLLYAFYLNYGFNLHYFRTPYKDYIYYANLSHSLVLSGQENYNIFHKMIPLKGANPYHYSELWFNGIVSFLFNIPNTKALGMLTYPIGRLIAFFGAWAVLNKIHTTRYNFLFAFMFLHFSGLCKNEWFDFSPWLQNVLLLYQEIVNIPKLFPVSIFIIAALLTYLEAGKTSFKTFFFLAFIAFSYFLATVGIGVLVTLLLLEKIFREKQIDYYSIATIATFLFIPLFYFIYRIPIINNLSLNLEYITSIQFLKYCIGEIISTTLKLSVIYILFIPLLLYIPYKKPYIYIIAISILICIIAYSVLRNTEDSIQIFSNYSIPLLNLIIFTFVYHIVYKTNNQWVRYYFIGSLIFYFIFKIYDGNIASKEKAADKQQIIYEETVTKALAKKGKLIAFFLNLTDSSSMNKKTHLNIPATFLYNSYPDYLPINLSVLDWPLKTKLDSIVVQASVFYQFHIKHPELSNEELKLKFIRDYNISTIILDNYTINELPEALQKIKYKKYAYKKESVLLLEK